jgi:fused signal recognition particle receptor
MASWLDALSRTRKNLADAFSKVFTRRDPADEETLEDLEAMMLQADMPVRLVADVVIELDKAARNARVPRQAVRDLLVKSLPAASPFAWTGATSPLVILAVGINGSGKTTTSAKLAHLAMKAGRKPMLGAADTFRAAGSHQLKIWADRIGCDAVTGATGADAAAVAFDAIDAATARGCDVVIIDTAGRMHTKQPLMEELQKVTRAIAKKLPGAPHECWIVLDASMGQNAIAQARMFNEAAKLTGVVVSKLDGSAKAGFVFAIAKELNVPIRFVGLGEGQDDLEPFDPGAFVDGLLGTEEANQPVA